MKRIAITALAMALTAPGVAGAHDYGRGYDTRNANDNPTQPTDVATVNSAQPIPTGPNTLFISAGYGHGAALLEIAAQGSDYAARQVWFSNRMKNKFNSSALHNGYLYGLDEGILACIDARTGEQKWKGGRYGYGQLLLAGGHIVLITEGGELVLIEATPDRHQDLARFQAIEGKTWNNPAISNGILLVRNTTEMAAFQLAP